MNAQAQRVWISCPDSHSPCLLPMGGSFGGHGFVLTVVWLVPQRYGIPTWVYLWGQEPCLCLTPRTWCYVCLLGFQPVLLAGWHLGLGEWSLNLAPQSWVWLAGASRLTSTLLSCDLGSSSSLTCASLPVLSFQPVTLPEGNKKSFPYWGFMELSLSFVFSYISLSPQIFSLGTNVNWTLTDHGSFLERSMVMICMWLQVSESCSERAQGWELEDLSSSALALGC